MPNRTDLLNHLAEKYNLQRYLEIGVQVPELNFDKIVCSDKIGVDPDQRANATIKATSDEFFGMLNERKPGTKLLIPIMFDQLEIPEQFDLVFIDGLHTAEQVKKDFENALKILSPNGFIVLHDCNPLKEEHTIVPRPTARGHWNGDVYKFAMSLFLTNKFTVDIDNGCMVIPYPKKHWDCLRIATNHWYHFDKNRKELLNLITWDEFIAIGS